VYVDGPDEKGARGGDFHELETVSPAMPLKPGESFVTGTVSFMFGEAGPPSTVSPGGFCVPTAQRLQARLQTSDSLFAPVASRVSPACECLDIIADFASTCERLTPRRQDQVPKRIAF
jgi:hypothetical protein